MNAHGLAGADLGKAVCLRGMSEQFIFSQTTKKTENFCYAFAVKGTQLTRHAPGRLPTRPLCRKICHSDCTENCPSAPPASTQEVSESENRPATRSEEHTSELQSRLHLVCRLLLEKKKKYVSNKMFLMKKRFV